MDVFTPRQHDNGIGVIWLVSGGWYSAREAISVPLSLAMIRTLAQRGYTVFAVVHSSQPQYNILSILPDLQHATRYIRYHAADYHIDPNRIGLTGASSGGHLALMQATNGDKGIPNAKDAINRTSSRVQAVACFFPPTDFLDYGNWGEDGLGRGRLKGFPAPFNFHESNPIRRLKIGRQISPINHVTSDDPPTLIIHGDKDPLVPLQQSEIFIAKLREAHVAAQLIIKPGVGHGWPSIEKDMPKIADWFDKYLLKR